MKMIKILYSKTWMSEYQLCKDENGFFLMPTVNTNFAVMPLSAFKEERFGKFVFRLANPENVHHTISEVCDVVEYNGILCYAFKNSDDKYQLHPAIGGNGFVMDSYYYDIGCYGKYDFENVNCHCGNDFFYNTSKIPLNEAYEVSCPKCGMLLKRKKV